MIVEEWLQRPVAGQVPQRPLGHDLRLGDVAVTPAPVLSRRHDPISSSIKLRRTADALPSVISTATTVARSCTANSIRTRGDTQPLTTASNRTASKLSSPFRRRQS